MNLSSLKPAENSVKSTKRIARGQGSGYGGTATRGHKGAKSRSSYKSKIGFEGGQTPLQRRVPKFGFKNFNRIEYRGINLDTLQQLVDDKKIKDIVTVDTLIENGLMSKNEKIKVLGRGELKDKLNVEVHAFSKSAKEIIEARGGQAKTL